MVVLFGLKIKKGLSSMSYTKINSENVGGQVKS